MDSISDLEQQAAQDILAVMTRVHGNLMSEFNETTDPAIIDELCYLMKANEMGQRFWRNGLRQKGGTRQ